MMLKYYRSVLLPIKVFLILLLIISPFGERVLWAQSNFPVSCSPYLLPQYSLNWSALTSSNNFLKVTLVLKDEKYQSGIVPVFLRFRFEQAGSVISTRLDYVPAIPINLSFGTPLTLYGSDLVNYFQAGNLIAQGAVDESLLRQGGRLPDGLWTLSVTAYEFDASRGHRQISETGIAMMQVFYGYPPQITYPAEGQVLQEQEVQNLLFSWMPRGTASRGGISGLIYTVELYEVSDGEVPNAVVQGKRPIFSTTTNTSNYLYGITDPALIVGRKYALRVRVQDIEGVNEYQNDGYSEVVSFNYGRPCTSPENLSLASSLSRVYNLSWDPQVGAQTYEVAYKLTTASVWTTAIAYTGTFSVVKPVEGKYEFKVRSNCSLARQSEWSEIYSEPVSVAVKSNSKPAASASNTSPPQTNSSNNSSNNSNGAGNVEDPLDIIVSSQDISPAAIAQKRDELDKLETPSESRCGGSMHSTVDCNITPKVYSGTVAFVPAKGQKIYMNGYEIIVTSGDASAGEGLLYYPFVRQRIPVSWSGISIVEGEKGKDYGCITEGEVKAQGSNGTVVTNDLERQITSLLSSGPGSYSGKFGEALEAMKAKAQELLDKIARGEKPGKEDYQEYNNICKAIKSGIESIKNTTQTQNTDPKFLAKIAPILNDLDSYKDKLLAEADCEGLGYHSALREAVFYASIKSQLYPEALVSICKLGESSSLAGNILNRIEDLAVETAAAKSSIKCGCDGLMDYLTGDGNCQSVIYNLELLKRDISKNKVSHKLNNPAGGTGQVKIGEICIDNLQIKFYGDNPEINPLSKQKTREGIDFSAANSSNIVLNVNVLDKAEKDKKIEAVWGYLGDGDKTQEDHKATFPVTGTQLHEIFPDTPQDRCDEVASIINKYSDDYGLTTPERMAHFIGQIGAETMLKNLDEKSYSASRILTADKTRTIRTHNGKKVLKYCSIFEGYSADGASCPYPYCDEDIVVPEGSYSGSYASTTFMQGMNKIVRANMVDELPRDPDFFNVVYACNDIGNGNINSGDGYRFRGRGFMQITGYSNYRKMVQAKWDEVHGRGTKDFMCRSETCDKNLDDIANDLDFSMLISLTFWKAGNTNDLANEVNKRAIQDVTIAVNGKEIGIDNRTLYTNKAYAVFKK